MHNAGAGGYGHPAFRFCRLAEQFFGRYVGHGDSPRAASQAVASWPGYLESAPWNLKGFSVSPRFLGIGTVLIAEAIRLSLEMGLKDASGCTRFLKPKRSTTGAG